MRSTIISFGNTLNLSHKVDYHQMLIITFLEIFLSLLCSLSASGFQIPKSRFAQRRHFEKLLFMTEEKGPNVSPFSSVNRVIWLKLSGDFGDDVLNVKCDPKLTSIFDLKKLVKLECSPMLDGVAAPKLKIRGADRSLIEEDVLLINRPEGGSISEAYLVETSKIGDTIILLLLLLPYNILNI